MTSTPSEREIKQAVTERYGARARAALETIGAEPAAEACCAPGEASGPQMIELLTPVAEDACCGDDCCAPGVDEVESSFGAALYSADQLGEVPDAAQLASAGCGNPVAIAELRARESVLDLGSGGGIDCFLAAKQVGPEGTVWGLDMTPDMVQLARKNAETVGASNVRFRLGEIEDMPFADGTFDAIISNCVINLSADKAQVFREAFRVLKPGGRLRVSDMVMTADLPEAERADLNAWAGCVAGALPVDDYLAAVRAAGFEDAHAEVSAESRPGIASAYVTAVRPA
jgi:SAM-dependent methyltransferase